MQQVFLFCFYQLLRLRGFTSRKAMNAENNYWNYTDPGFTRIADNVDVRWSMIVEIDPNIETAPAQNSWHHFKCMTLR